MLRIRTILHPTDFSDTSDQAFQLARALARDYTARLVVVHVRAPDVVYTGLIGPMPLDPRVQPEALGVKLESYRAPELIHPVEHQIREGNPVNEILHAAEETGCDLIVMGSQGRTGLDRILLGSVAEGVMRRAPCPVLTIRPTAPAAATPTSTSNEPALVAP